MIDRVQKIILGLSIRHFFFTSEPRLVLGEWQDGLVQVGGRLAVDGDGVGRRVRLEVASQGPAQRTAASGDAGETTELVSVPEIAKTFQLSI